MSPAPTSASGQTSSRARRPALRRAATAALGLLAVSLAATALAGATPTSRLASTPVRTTFAQAGDQALQTLLQVYYGGNGLWNQCNSPNCAQANSDWGADSLTYALYLSWATGPTRASRR